MASMHRTRLAALPLIHALCSDSGQRPRVASVEIPGKVTRRRRGLLNRADLVTRIYRHLCDDHSKGYADAARQILPTVGETRPRGRRTNRWLSPRWFGVENLCWRIHRF